MYKCTVKNKNNEITNQRVDESQAALMAWATQFVTTPRKLSRRELLAEKRIPGDYEMEVTQVGGEDVVRYIVPAELSVEIVDYTAEYQAELEALESLEAADLFQQLKVWIRATNKNKLRTGVWSEAKFMEFISSPTIANAERALNQASLKTYKSLVLQSTAFYTQEEIASVVAKLDAHINKWLEKGVV